MPAMTRSVIWKLTFTSLTLCLILVLGSTSTVGAAQASDCECPSESAGCTLRSARVSDNRLICNYSGQLSNGDLCLGVIECNLP